MTTQAPLQVLQFDGRSTYVQLASAQALGITDRDFTVEAWVRVDEGAGDLAVLGMDVPGVNACLHLIVRSRRPFMGFYHNDTGGKTELAPGVWYHLAWRYTKTSGEQAIFVNGILDASSQGHASFRGAAPLVIGRWGGSNYFYGAIAELRIWSYARRDAEILADMQRRLQGAEPGLSGYWRLNDGSGSIAADSSARQAHGELRGNPAWAPSALPFLWELDKVLAFDGSKDRITISPLKGFPSQELTFECWLRSGNSSKAGTVVSYANSQFTNAFELFDYRNLEPKINGVSVKSGVAFNDGRWHHLAVSWRASSGALVVYQDGVQRFEGVLATGQAILDGGAFILGQEQDAVLGGFDPAQAFMGELAEVRLWRVARSAKAITNDMHRRLSGSERDLVGYWPLSNAPDIIVRDLTAGNQYGELNGPTWAEPTGPVPAPTNQVLSLDGVDDFLQVPADIWFQDDFTVEGWVFLRKHSSWARLIDFGNGPSQDNVLLAVSQGVTGQPNLSIIVRPAAQPVTRVPVGQPALPPLPSLPPLRPVVLPPTQSTLNLSAPLPLLRWVHLAFVLQGTVGHFYVDGQEVGTNPSMTPPQGYKRTQNYIGRSNWDGDGYPSALFSEVRIWDQARTPDEIWANAGKRLTGSEPGLLGCWHLDEGAGTLAANVARPTFGATISGGAVWVKPDAPIPASSGKVLAFDGLDDYVSILIDLPETEATHELWFRTGDPNAGIFGVTDRDLGEGGWDRGIYLRDGNICARIWSNEAISSAGLSLGDAQWHHVAHVFGASVGGQRMYVDGQLVASGKKQASNFTSQKRINIGFCPDATHPHFTGQICQVRVWEKARSADEILSTMLRRASGGEPGLLGCWALDDGEGYIVADSSPAQREGYLSGPSWRLFAVPLTPPAKAVLDLDGNDDLVYVDGFRWDQGGPITIEGWVRVSEIGVHRSALLTIGNQDSPNRITIHAPWEDRNLYWDYGDINAGGRVTVDFTPYLDCWTHIALVSQGRGGTFMGIYLNGRLVASAPRSDGPKSALRGLWLGQGLGTAHAGQVSEVRVWRRVRSVDEIRSALGVRLQGNEPDLVGYWKLDETALDSLVTRPGAISAGAWADFNAPMQQQLDVPPPTLPAATFDGAAGYIAIPHADQLGNLQALTVEAWVRPAAQSGEPLQHPVVAKHGTATGWDLRCSGAKAELMVTLNREQVIASAAVGADSGQWYHLAGVYDGRELQIFLNGVLKGTSPAQGQVTPYLGALNIGRSPNWTDRLFAGQIADVRVWNRARTPLEIHTTLFHRLRGDEVGLVGYWRLDEGPTGEVRDSTSYQLTGVQSGVAWPQTEVPLAMADGEAGVVVTVEEQMRRLGAQIERLRRDLEQARGQMSDLEQNRSQLHKTIKDLSDEKQQLQATQAHLAEAHTLEITALNEAHLNELNQLRMESGAQVTLAQLIQKTNTELQDARRRLQADNSNYRLGRVTMELRMLPAADGVSMIFPKQDDVSKLGQLSTINLDFTPPPVAEKAQAQSTVPDVMGYTELLARRRLSESGFAMQVYFQAVTVVEGKPSQEDRVVNQFPKAGDQAPPMSTITVLIGKRS